MDDGDLTAAKVPLARLETRPVRNAWPDEAKDFTPWLAKPPDLALLGKTLGLPLEVEAQEKAVGPEKLRTRCASGAPSQG